MKRGEVRSGRREGACGWAGVATALKRHAHAEGLTEG